MFYHVDAMAGDQKVLAEASQWAKQSRARKFTNTGLTFHAVFDDMEKALDFKRNCDNSQIIFDVVLKSSLTL